MSNRRSKESDGVMALIPARGGSKSVPKKNIRLLGGHPLIAYTIDVCRRSPLIGRVIVSTDDEEIAEVARRCGAETPFLRPAALAQDDSPDRPVFLHALNWLAENQGYAPRWVFHLRPTSPFRTVEDIAAVYDLFKKTACDAVRSVSPVSGISHPYWAYVEKDGYGRHFIDDPEIQARYTNRQSLPPAYKAHGLVDGYTPQSIRKSQDMLGERLILYKVPWALDIDSEVDFDYAEYLLVRGRVRGL